MTRAPAPPNVDPVTYTIRVQHWHDGDISIQVDGIDSGPSDRQAVAYCLKQAAIHVLRAPLAGLDS